MDSSTSVTYIYALLDPRDGSIRYIGKADNPYRRLANHLTPGQLRKKSRKNSWLKSLQSSGLKPYITALCCIPRTKWQDAERMWIAKFKAEGNRLTNGTAGGDGVCDPSPEVRAKLSARKSVPWNAGMKMSDEWKRVHPNARAQTGKSGYWAGKKLSLEHIEKLSAAKKGKPSWSKGVPRRQSTKDKLSREWVVVSPEGIRRQIRNLKQFCKDNGLQDALMHHVATGKRRHHKGWLCWRIEKQ